MSSRNFLPFSPKNQVKEINLVLPFRLIRKSKPYFLINLPAMRISLGQLHLLGSFRNAIINNWWLLNFLGFFGPGGTKHYGRCLQVVKRLMSFFTIFPTRSLNLTFGDQESSSLAGSEFPSKRSTSAGL